jgi:hypothetical protein
MKWVLRWADHPSKESYRLSLMKKLRRLSPMLQKQEQAPKCGSNEEEGKKMVWDTEIRWWPSDPVLIIQAFRVSPRTKYVTENKFISY